MDINESGNTKVFNLWLEGLSKGRLSIKLYLLSNAVSTTASLAVFPLTLEILFMVLNYYFIINITDKSNPSRPEPYLNKRRHTQIKHIDHYDMSFGEYHELSLSLSDPNHTF